MHPTKSTRSTRQSAKDRARAQEYDRRYGRGNWSLAIGSQLVVTRAGEAHFRKLKVSEEDHEH